MGNKKNQRVSVEEGKAHAKEFADIYMSAIQSPQGLFADFGHGLFNTNDNSYAIIPFEC